MTEDNFKGYAESRDKTKIPSSFLVYPSKNVIITKGKVITRGGITNDGVAPTTTEKVHSSFVWKDALGGQRHIRCTGRLVQVYYDSKWLTIYSAISATALRVFFATWVDSNGAIYKKRLVMADGSTNLYTWNGAISTVASYSAQNVTLDTTDTMLQEGHDVGTTTNQTVIHYGLTAGVVTSTVEYLHDDDCANNIMHLTTVPSPVPVAGDIIIAKPVAFANAVSSAFNIDVVYSYQNHLICANYNSVQLYWSHIVTYSLATGFDFTMPVLASRSAVTPILMTLDGNFTAMIARKNVLWISDADDWYKVVKNVSVNAYGLWVDVEKFETGDGKGALPMAVAKHKGDIIYLAQDKTLQRIITLEISGQDQIKLMSDEVEDMFRRIDLTDVRLDYFTRAIYITCPNDSTLMILDMVEGNFQPPQTMPLNCMSFYGGYLYGHSNAVDETFFLFDGLNDLETPIEAIIALPLYHSKSQFEYKKHEKIGVSCRITGDTTVLVEQYFEEDYAKGKQNYTIDGATIKTFSVSDDVSWATNPYATRAWGGADLETTPLKRAMVFKKYNAISYFDHSIKMTVSGDNNNFQLLAVHIDEQVSTAVIGQDLFISN